MTYAHGWSLQQALFAALGAHAPLTALVGDRIYDSAPYRATQSEAPYLLLGDETVAPWSTASDMGAAHEISVSAVASEAGFATVKQAAAAACDALLGPIALDSGRVVSSRFLGARTRRGRRGEMRRVDMRFRFVVEDQS
jgi:hypothetical protein